MSFPIHVLMVSETNGQQVFLQNSGYDQHTECHDNWGNEDNAKLDIEEPHGNADSQRVGPRFNK